MTFRQTTKEDYETLLKWWKDNRFPAPPIDSLPNSGEGGFIVFQDDIPVCAGFLYDTNSNLCWIEFIVANFEVKDKKLRKEALVFLINTLCEAAKRWNKKAVFTSVKNVGLIDRYKDCGFIGDRTYEMVRLLD